jgi:phosphoglycerol transferase MdoB-like AlkP superfamily enzyme
MLGKDLFNTNAGIVIYRNGSFIDDEVFYSSPSNTFYDVKTGHLIEENDSLKAKKEDTAVQLEYSDDILIHNLLKKYNEDNSLGDSN